MFIRSNWNYDRNAASKAAGFKSRDKSRTSQSDLADSDINVIVKRFGLTGQINEAARPILYGDFAETFDFQSAQNALVAANRAFMGLPATTRARFGNDPQQFMEFCNDKENLPELRKMGLAKAEVKPVPEVIQKVEIINPPGDNK